MLAYGNCASTGCGFARPLMIDQYQETRGRMGWNFQANPDVTLQLTKFAWTRAFSPVDPPERGRPLPPGRLGRVD